MRVAEVKISGIPKYSECRCILAERSVIVWKNVGAAGGTPLSAPNAEGNVWPKQVVSGF
jgi:hypothetical protein